MPARSTWTTTSPAPATGSGTSITRTSRGPWNTAARMAIHDTAAPGLGPRGLQGDSWAPPRPGSAARAPLGPLPSDRANPGAPHGIVRRQDSPERRGGRMPLSVPATADRQAWTREVLAPSDWLVPVPQACGAELHGALERWRAVPRPRPILPPSAFDIGATAALMSRVREKLE